MTENEAKYYLLEHKPIIGFKTHNEALDVAIQALEEIQQYRAIGTVEQFEWCKDASHWKELFKEKLEQYEAIGTIEEFKEMKEKATPKKPREWANGTLHCPNEDCEFDNTCLGFDVCVKCGQKLDFGKGE